jgi:hypothetical protein
MKHLSLSQFFTLALSSCALTTHSAHAALQASHEEQINHIRRNSSAAIAVLSKVKAEGEWSPEHKDQFEQLTTEMLPVLLLSDENNAPIIAARKDATKAVVMTIKDSLKQDTTTYVAQKAWNILGEIMHTASEKSRVLHLEAAISRHDEE